LYVVWEVACTRNARKRAMQHRYRHAAAASWWTERNFIPPTIEAAATQGRDEKEKVAEGAHDYNGKDVLFSHTAPGLSAAVLRSNTQQQQQPQPPSVTQACSKSVEA
jgi:hypothetical protein